MSNVQMRRAFPDLTAKTQIVLLEVDDEEGMYERSGDTWYLLGGCGQECAVSALDTAPLSGVDRPGKAEDAGMMTRLRDGAAGNVAADSGTPQG